MGKRREEGPGEELSRMADSDTLEIVKATFGDDLSDPELAKGNRLLQSKVRQMMTAKGTGGVSNVDLLVMNWFGNLMEHGVTSADMKTLRTLLGEDVQKSVHVEAKVRQDASTDEFLRKASGGGTETVDAREKWTCLDCGAECRGKFCPECGRRKPGDGEA